MASRSRKPTKKPRRSSVSISEKYERLLRRFRRLTRSFDIVADANRRFSIANQSIYASNEKMHETLLLAEKLIGDLKGDYERVFNENKKLHADLLRVVEGKFMDVAMERARSVPGHKPS
jgi:hypothetical protein